MATVSSSRGSIALLGALYFVQGIPFGFQTKTLKYYLTERGVSLTTIALAGALALPWALKPLWAPFVDRFGTRRQWLLPLQLMLLATLLAAARVPVESELNLLLVLVLAMNVLTATQDIVVDGIAVDLLPPAGLGGGNAAQVVGYKLGMLASGSLLVLLTPDWAWQFGAMAVLSITGLVAGLRLPAFRAGGAAMSPTFREIGRALALSIRAPGGLLLVGFIATYRLGESISDAMWMPLLQRGFGIAKETLAAWDVSWGMPASILGSLLGGWVSSRLGRGRAVAVLATARLLPAALQLLVVLIRPDSSSTLAASVVGITMAEELTGGALTTAMFAFMMGHIDRRIGATHYTALAAIEVMGKAPGGLSSGRIADELGFAGAFGMALGLSALALLWLPWVSRPTQKE